MAKRTTPANPAVVHAAPGETVQNGPTYTAYFNWRTFRPEMLEGGTKATFAKELMTYRDRLDEILQHEGEFVVIKGNTILGYYPKRKLATAAARAVPGDAPVLVKLVVEKEPIRKVGAAQF